MLAVLWLWAACMLVLPMTTTGYNKDTDMALGASYDFGVAKLLATLPDSQD